MAEVVRGTAGGHQFEADAAGQRLAPEPLVVPAQARAVGIRILAPSVGPEVEGGVNHHDAMIAQAPSRRHTASRPHRLYSEHSAAEDRGAVDGSNSRDASNTQFVAG